MTRLTLLLAALAGLSLLAATGSSGGAGASLSWRQLAQAQGVVDVVGPRADGRFVVATRQGLLTMRRTGSTAAFARSSYGGSAGEPYVALTPKRKVPGAGCSFRRDDVYALEPTATPGVTVIRRNGTAHPFASLPAGSFPSAIAFDGVGRFGYRLLVAAVVSKRTTLYAVDCLGRARVVVRDAPAVEGGAAVAPATAGILAGKLVAADEITGRVYSFDVRGRVRTVVRPSLTAGQDLGVESLGFVPPRFARTGAAFMADLGAPGSPTEGTDSVLTMRGRGLYAAGVRAGDLLVATEAGGVTISLRCRTRCRIRRIGQALSATHAEGRIAFAAR